jgi:hypothetical protein
VKVAEKALQKVRIHLKNAVFAIKVFAVLL